MKDMIKLRPIMFGDCMEIIEDMARENEYYKKEGSTDILTGDTREYLMIDGMVDIIGYLPCGNAIWYFPN